MLSIATDGYSSSVDLLGKQQQEDFDHIIHQIEDCRYGIDEETAIQIDNLDDRSILLALIIRCIESKDDNRYKRAGRHASNRLTSLFYP